MTTAEACVSEASTWATNCVAFERARGSEDPLATVARQARVPRNAIWSLLYRPPKRIAAEIYLSVGRLYEKECGRQAAKYAAERQITEAKTRIGRALLRASDALAGCSPGET